MTTHRVCSGVRKKPLQYLSPAQLAAARQLPEQGHLWLRSYGKAKCSVCRGWYVAHKDGTPVHHKLKPWQ